MAARHFKYAYNAHLPPKTIFSKMILVNDPLIKNLDLNAEKNRIYFSRRKQLKNLMKSVNSYIDFNSQTYFLMLYYMDIIFTHKDLEKIFYSHFTLWYQYPIVNDLQMSNYVLLSLACLVVASKFNENDPMVPSMSSYIRLLYEFSKKKFIFNLDSLFLAEIVVLKILKYKLNYYTIYHYLIFFFTHGIVLKKTIERSKTAKKISERKILEKVYIKVREIFDELIESENYYQFYCGKNNYEIVVEILLWCTEHILDEKIEDDENIFKLIYGINIEPNKKKEMYNIIEQLHSKIKRKNFLNKSSHLPEGNNINNMNSNLLNPSTNIISNRMKANAYNYNYADNTDNYNIIQKSGASNSTMNTNQTSYDHYPVSNQKNINNDYFNYMNSSIEKEALNYNNIKYFYNNNINFLSQAPFYNNIYNHQNIQLNKTTDIKYGPNKRIYLTTNKITKSNFNVNSIDKMNLKTNIEEILTNKDNSDFNKKCNSSRQVKIIPFQVEKEPNDNRRQINDVNPKIILINNYNNDPKLPRKKSFSCNKNISKNNYDNENDNDYYQPRPSANDESIRMKKLKIEHKIRNTKILPPSSSKEINSYFVANKTNEPKKEKKEAIERPLVKKEIILRTNKNQNSEYKRYLLSKNLLPKNSLNGKHINNSNSNSDHKVMKDNIVNRTRYFDSNSIVNNNLKKFNVTLELEPQDNYKRRSVNKYYIDSGKSNINKNKSYNNANTIIINNNIQINTLYDDKSRNLYLVHNDEINEGIQYNYESKYRSNKSNKNKMKLKTEIKDLRRKYE